MEPLNEPNGIKLVEDAKQYLDGPNSCWRNAYRNLSLAWELSDCFQKGSGRPSFPKCDSRATIQTCCKKLDDSAHKIYHGYYLKTDSICHQLHMKFDSLNIVLSVLIFLTHCMADAFKYETERLVNGLKKSAELAEEKFETSKKNLRLLSSNATSVRDTKKVKDQMDVQLEHSNVVLKRSKEIVESQSELLEGRADMRKEMEMLHESHENLSHNINEVSNSMSTKMENLQNKADDVGNALDQFCRCRLIYFYIFFRATLQTLADFSRHQQDELLKGQEQLRLAQDQIVEESKSILAAQEAFRSKQASMLMELDRHFTLINRILLDTGLIKACMFYPFVLFVLSVLTSFKRTHHMRGWLLLGLAVIFLVEISSWMYWYGLYLDKQVTIGKNSFLVVAALRLLYSAFTQRSLVQLNKGRNGYDDDIDFLTWIDEDLPEDNCTDPDFMLPERVAENSITTSSFSRKYDLLPRPSSPPMKYIDKY
ncbi:hypothetical protein MKX01_009684 [Papaver californicum]|nr:hypothetical protein MKX01_009684 [Papaver californicum]